MNNQKRVEKSQPLNDPDYDLWALITQARRSMLKCRARELHKYRLTPVESGVLHIIRATNGNATPTLIARWLIRETHSISGLIQRMRKEGLIRVKKDKKDKRSLRIVMSEKGEVAFKQSLKRESIHEVLSVLSKEERESLGKSLSKVLDRAIEMLGKEPIPYLKESYSP